MMTPLLCARLLQLGLGVVRTFNVQVEELKHILLECPVYDDLELHALCSAQLLLTGWITLIVAG
jgi:hypothetical protein